MNFYLLAPSWRMAILLKEISKYNHQISNKFLKINNQNSNRGMLKVLKIVILKIGHYLFFVFCFFGASCLLTFAYRLIFHPHHHQFPKFSIP